MGSKSMNTYHIEFYPIKWLSYALFIYILMSSSVCARDLGQWENSDPQIKEWYRNLMRPDAPSFSCCGDADAYWCDDISVIDNPAASSFCG